MTDPIAIQMNVTRAFSEGSGATWLTTVAQHAKLEEINAVSDKIMSALARQDTWARIAMLNNEIEMHSKQKAQILFSIASLEEKHGDFTSCNKDIKAGYHQTKEGLLRIEMLIKSLITEQARLQGLLGG